MIESARTMDAKTKVTTDRFMENASDVADNATDTSAKGQFGIEESNR